MTWSVRVPSDYVLGHVRAVLPDRVVDDARLVVRDGRIAEVAPHPPGFRADLDGQGLLCLPGLVDVHSDALAREFRPRPGSSLPAGFALRSVEQKLVAAGITTAFHGIAFQDRSAVGMPIDSPSDDDLYDVLRAHESHQVDHRVLHRLDVRCSGGVRRLRARLASLPGDVVPLVSYEDHTPGQGQYADPTVMERWLVEAEGLTGEAAAAHVASLRSDRDQRLDQRTETLDWLAAMASAGQIRLVGHDPATRSDVDQLVAGSAAVAEFPTTRAAAEAARERGLLVVAGAVNVLRGGSHAGNVSAGELVEAGLVDALTCDYLPSALLPAAMELVRAGTMELPAAVRLVTSGPAAVAGLTDRGVLGEGYVAHLVLADTTGRWPTVRLVHGSH
ncbi:alpha-D-ribose 1-methylphosphonate 5-triphosphate diphosphatase [Kribbella sp. CA-293567]|uniref:alpha-D-ribose 1-methylphosphonate 5-triphosphate diphosphatase n=1 Tax=Kribbella sp. CA-293567 TaxID=3002436 RepID=UPI0022DD2A2B|nr:alpha-D-ribose 1-methylphosphonate 5-triphosphate diphosphatase [Kribbella sp. CA-293567]WBQ04419.1 alpha-D-ribose 1-methylphosphonate 5-triphosphate diphosphatase [Kribbella sp. CA-293567]